MNFKKELGKQNRAQFIADVKKLYGIDLNYEYDAYLDKNPYRIYIEIKPQYCQAIHDFCKRRGYVIEYHIRNFAWVTFDLKKMKSWYAEFNSDYSYNLNQFIKD